MSGETLHKKHFSLNFVVTDTTLRVLPGFAAKHSALHTLDSTLFPLLDKVPDIVARRGDSLGISTKRFYMTTKMFESDPL